MSAEPGEKPEPRPVSRAAELAAQQVESIVAVAQESAEKLTRTAREEAASVRALARESAHADVEAARKEASTRIREAQDAADDVLEQAKAVSGGMKQLAHLLTTHAERILRDVTNSHRAMSADLRAAARNEPLVDDERPTPAAGESAGPPASDEPVRARRRDAGRENPFADLEPPSWVEG
jgi:cell division septum initiation protein DivIVA